jgi:midasin
LISPISPRSTLESSAGGADSAIDVLLVNAQAMLARCTTVEDNHSLDDSDNFIREGSRFFTGLTGVLHIEKVLRRLLELLPQLANSPQHNLQRSLLRFLPFLDRYAALVRDQLVSHCQWTQALFKLNFVLCSVMHTIAKQGFCKPPDTDETGSNGETTDAVDGVGLGAGSGMENVSKEIEDESQVEGMQGEENDVSDARNDTGDDNTIEMSDDFSGALEDVPDNNSQDNDESDEEGEAEPEEQLGDLDASDPTAVDEKLWGDEQGPQENDDTEKTNNRSEEQGKDADVVAKDGEQPEPKEAKQEKSNKNGAPETTDDPVPEEDEIQNPEANGAPLDDYVQDANTLDLPDDMDLGHGDDVPEPDIGGESEENVSDDGNPDTLDDPCDDAESPTSPDAMGDEISEQVQEAHDSGDAPEEEHPQEPAVAQPDVSAGDGSLGPDEPQNVDNAGSTSTGQKSGGSGGGEGKSTEDRDRTQEQSR